MRGKLLSETWRPDPARYAPARYRLRPCSYEAFLPDAVAGFDGQLPASLLGMVSETEQAILRLNAGGGPALGPLARLLLRSESIASSKVEGLQIDARELARAEARGTDTGRRAS